LVFDRSTSSNGDAVCPASPFEPIHHLHPFLTHFAVLLIDCQIAVENVPELGDVTFKRPSSRTISHRRYRSAVWISFSSSLALTGLFKNAEAPAFSAVSRTEASLRALIKTIGIV
jgi:hypothetical protein